MVTTHSPFFVNALKPKELVVVYRDTDGYTQGVRPTDMPIVQKMLEEGGKLGDLWMEGYFSAGDPLTNAGGSKNGPVKNKSRE